MFLHDFRSWRYGGGGKPAVMADVKASSMAAILGWLGGGAASRAKFSSSRRVTPSLRRSRRVASSASLSLSSLSLAACLLVISDMIHRDGICSDLL